MPKRQRSNDEVTPSMDSLSLSLSLMEKAIYCFKQADNKDFEEKAKTQGKSFEFRCKLFVANRVGGDGASLSWAEKEAAEHMENLLKENLLA